MLDCITFGQSQASGFPLFLVFVLSLLAASCNFIFTIQNEGCIGYNRT